MYEPNLVRVCRMERVVTDFPRVRVERFPMVDTRRFKLTLRSDQFRLGNDGSLHIWLDRGDVSNLQFDCSRELLEDDIENGGDAALELVNCR